MPEIAVGWIQVMVRLLKVCCVLAKVSINLIYNAGCSRLYAGCMHPIYNHLPACIAEYHTGRKVRLDSFRNLCVLFLILDATNWGWYKQQILHQDKFRRRSYTTFRALQQYMLGNMFPGKGLSVLNISYMASSWHTYFFHSIGMFSTEHGSFELFQHPLLTKCRLSFKQSGKQFSKNTYKAIFIRYRR